MDKSTGLWQQLKNQTIVKVTGTPKGLVDFSGTGKYNPPEFTWNETVGPTAIKFLHSDKLGKQYQNTIFVGDVDTGNLYNFKLNPQRTALLLDGELADKVADNPDELSSVIFGKGFGGITDIQVGPDGYLYVLSLYQGSDDCGVKTNSSRCIAYGSSPPGTIFRIVPERIVVEGGTNQMQQQLQNTSIANKSNNNINQSQQARIR